MREYVLTQAQSRQAFGRWTAMVHLFKNWQRRRDVKTLLRIDEAILVDLGIGRDDLNDLLARRLDADWAWEMDQTRNAPDRQSPPSE